MTQSIEELLRSSEEELLVSIGMEINEGSLALPRRRDWLTRSAKRWLKVREDTLRQAICSSDRVRTLVHDSQDVLLVTAVADLILSICTGVSPITVAALLVRRGISELCMLVWKDEEGEEL